MLVFFLAEEVWEMPFCQFVQTKRFRKIGKTHRDEIQRVDELNVKEGNI